MKYWARITRSNYRNIKEKSIEVFFSAISITALLILIGIFVFLFITGIQAFSETSPAEFFLGNDWNPSAYTTPRYGTLGLVTGTLMVTLGSLIIAIPLGIMSAVYLSEIASPKVREIVKPVIEMIASIPSVVLGLIGILFLSPLIAGIFGLSSGLNAFTSSIIVGIMVLPTIISISEDVLTSLPQEFREASLALGATRWQMIKMTLLPAALSGIIASIMLGLGRAVGETMAVLMVAGNSRAMPRSFFDPIRPMTANIAIEIKEVVKGSLHYEALFAIGLVLFVMTFLVNFISDIIIERQVGRFKW
ncbi:MAG: phosphate ABC transporter permease subunit PstC [Candidatus Altiarchaeota archaeon]|nr:phosphate ABC transporter permease subunit PstC [Candidatus Altiarchaeota archaeon]MBU4342292.1 phosphate ABC transporter permease subunit PstC [Candidatus Altiarchaeota archaeon]MBU4432767.1 phosphate ABC transporter permease subunit PstC [Patescibacteria group bacterium]MBU4437469.1 phosphate ABC transporter permease subunit PstC [Candidatus Altiarchaeota archaeon]